ncbi:cobyrinate a,c-diamide synthase, partial [Acidianus sp. RZ1]
MESQVPRIVIASDRSNSGKTLISSGIMKALSKRMKVRGFKVGPDFIDPGYHKIATGSPSFNLDLFMMGSDNVIKTLLKYSPGYDISVIEGVMGLYDGIGIEFSTYKLSELTKTPIVLVMDCSNVSTTVGAIIEGLKKYRNARVEGVIFNKVGSSKHFEYCKEATTIPVLGFIPWDKSIQIPSRHLGLYTVEGYREAERVINNAAKLIEENVDLDKLIEIANSTEQIELNNNHKDLNETANENKKVAAIAYDQAFSFYYTENLDRISEKYKIEFFSPINNEKIDEAEFIYIGGGYPELFMKELEASTTTIKWI